MPDPFVDDPDFTDCDLFSGYVGRDGYGRVNRGSPARAQLAHRWMWEQFNGTIPDGSELHHVCGNTRCVNPDHLQLVTPQEHKMLEQAARTHCRRGHAYAEHGRYHSGTTARYCRACERDNERRRDAAVRV